MTPLRREGDSQGKLSIEDLWSVVGKPQNDMTW
jgi:hypothetical protein